jgi:hypothetical protein
MAHRKVQEIDAELSRTVQRRRQSKRQISILMSGIVNDTRFIDQLLAERSASCADALADALVGLTGEGRGR